MSSELTAYSSPWRMALIIVGAAIFVAMGLWFIGVFGEAPEPRRGSRELVQIVGWASIVFFGTCAIVGIRRAFDTGAQLRISAQGIYWKPWSEDTIPWREIREFRTWEYRRQKAIVLLLCERERFPSRTILGKVASINRALSGGDISISLTGLDRSFDEAFHAINEFWRTR